MLNALILISQSKYLIFRLIFIQFANTMCIASKFLGVDIACNPDIEGKFVGVDAIWLGGLSPTSKYKRKICLDLLITKFTKKYLSLNL